MERWKGRVALVTGASSGIGAGICRELVKHGLTVAGCARRVELIIAIAEEEEVRLSPGKLHALKCDLTKESDILAVFDYIRQKFGRIDICVNNAAFSRSGFLLSGETSDWRNILEVNVLALCICTKESIKLMREKNIDDGQIIHMSSIVSHYLPNYTRIPGFYFYCGTKFLVRAITEGLRREIKATNTHIRVASISPGLVETEIIESSFGKNAANVICSSIKVLQPKDIADAVIYILQCPPHVDVNDIIVTSVEQANLPLTS